MKLYFLGLIGYTCVFLVNLVTFFLSRRAPIDILANIIFLIGLAALVLYYYQMTFHGITEENHRRLKKLRITAHSTIALFFLLILLPFSKSAFKYFYTFGLLGHLLFLFEVITKNDQLLGELMIALFFICMTHQNIQHSVVKTIGPLLLSIYFIIAFSVNLYEDIYKL